MIDWRWTKVDTLEKQERWNEAILLLENSWRQNPNDLKTTIRLGFICWYILVEEGPLEIKNIDLEKLETLLNEVTQFGLTNFITNKDFLWCFGYMMSLFPYFFGDYEFWEEKGILMLKTAYELCPDDPIYKYTYSGSYSNKERKLKKELHHVQAVLEERFQGEGVLSEYFKEIWRINKA